MLFVKFATWHGRCMLLKTDSFSARNFLIANSCGSFLLFLNVRLNNCGFKVGGPISSHKRVKDCNFQDLRTDF